MRFRNLLEHGYAVLDDDRVAAYLDELADLDRFVAGLADFLD